MINLLRAEWRKTFSVKLWWGMLLGAMAFAAFAVSAQIATAGSGRSDLPPLSTAAAQHSIFGSAASAEIFALVVGIILITSEYRHFTSRPTFLIEPRRGHVIVAKLLLSAVVGLLYGLCCVAVTVAIAVPWLGAKGVTIGWTSNDVLSALVGVVLAVGIYAILGLGVGVLVRNQIAAVIGSIAYLFILEPLISILPGISGVYRFLPGATTTAIVQVSRNPNITLLTQWQGAVLLTAWGILFALLGWIVSLRRDVQ